MVVNLCSQSLVGWDIEMCHYVGDVLLFLVCVHFCSAQLTIFISSQGRIAPHLSRHVHQMLSSAEKEEPDRSYNSAGEMQCICPPGIKAHI